MVATVSSPPPPVDELLDDESTVVGIIPDLLQVFFSLDLAKMATLSASKDIALSCQMR